MKKQETIRNIFEKVMDHPKIENVEELDIDKELNDLFDIHKETVEVVEGSTKLMQEVAEEYDQVELDEVTLGSEDKMDPSQMNEDTNLLIMAFIEIVAEVNAEGLNEEAANTASKDNEKEADSRDNEEIEMKLAEKGSTEVAFDAEVEIKNNQFLLNGKSNLIEGSTVSMHAFHYGAESPY